MRAVVLLYVLLYFIVFLPTGLGAVVLAAALCNSVSRSLPVGSTLCRAFYIGFDLLDKVLYLLFLGGLHFPCDNDSFEARHGAERRLAWTDLISCNRDPLVGWVRFM